MFTFVLSILIISRLLVLFFSKFKNGLLYPEYFILIPPIFIFIIPFALKGFVELSSLTNFGLLIIFLLSLIDSKYLYKKFKFKIIKIKTSRNFFLNFISILGYLYLFILLSGIYSVLKSSSIIEILITNRLESYFEESIDQGSAIGTLSVVLSFFYYIKISNLFLSKKYYLAFALIFVEIFYLMLFAVTRLSIVFPIISFILFLLFFLKVGIKKILLISIAFMFLLVLYMSFSNKLRTGESSSDTISFNESIKDVSDELNYEKYHVLAVKYTEINGFEYGYGWFLGAIVNFVPRFLYENKPVTSSANRFTEKVTGSAPSMYNPVITFTIIGDGYFQLGYLGVVFNLIIYYILSSIIFWKLYSLPNSLGIYPAIRFSFMAFIYFRAEIPFIQFFVYLILIYFTNVLIFNDGEIQNSNN
jgi:hypothetical protein